ncbi:MAG: hypothetical protein MJK04_23895 [Psychrosphaera sp.]|nr:hypothetical protein [Psychrosphaera sp.]
MNLKQIIVILTVGLLFRQDVYAQSTALCTPGQAQDKQVIGYTVSADKKITIVDMLKGCVIAISKPIDGLGGLSNIDINTSRQHLYIGSDRGIQGASYTPLVTVDLKDYSFKVLNRFDIEPYFDLKSDPKRTLPKQNAVYQIVASPDGKLLYIADSASQEKPITTAIDSLTGEIVFRTAVVVRPQDLFSPDQKLIVEMWPSGQDPLNSTKIWPAGVAVGNIKEGKWITKTQLTGNKGFQPPWQKLDSPFIYFDLKHRALKIYERDSRKILSVFNLAEKTGLYVTQTYPTLMPNTTGVAFSMVDSEQQGYIVVIDVIKQMVKQKIKVGRMPTNVVISGGS